MMKSVSNITMLKSDENSDNFDARAYLHLRDATNEWEQTFRRCISARGILPNIIQGNWVRNINRDLDTVDSMTCFVPSIDLDIAGQLIWAIEEERTQIAHVISYEPIPDDLPQFFQRRKIKRTEGGLLLPDEAVESQQDSIHFMHLAEVQSFDKIVEEIAEKIAA